MGRIITSERVRIGMKKDSKLERAVLVTYSNKDRKIITKEGSIIPLSSVYKYERLI